LNKKEAVSQPKFKIVFAITSCLVEFAVSMRNMRYGIRLCFTECLRSLTWLCWFGFRLELLSTTAQVALENHTWFVVKSDSKIIIFVRLNLLNSSFPDRHKVYWGILGTYFKSSKVFIYFK